MDEDGGIREQIEANLTALYGPGDTDEKVEHRGRVIQADGTINKFQETALRGMVRRKADEEAPKGSGQLDPRAPTAPIPQVAPEFAADIPEPVEGYEDRIDLVGAIKGQVGIAEAVNRWGKPQENFKVGNRTDGIHVRCPFPSHVDSNPSAWINTTKDAWFCGGCQVGGDQIDFYAAAQYGYQPDDSFHRSPEFRKVLVEIAGLLGIDTEPPPAAPLPPIPDPVPDDDPDDVLPMPEPEIPAAEDNRPPTAPIDPKIASLEIDFDPIDLDPLDDPGLPEYDWLDLELQSGSFLSDWMIGNTEDLPWIPPEFFIMLGFQALGLACGHHLQTVTNQGVLNASLMLTLIGPSGSGKSLALERMTDLFLEGGSRWDPNLGTGIKVFTTPGSPEQLLKTMRHDVEDPGDPLTKVEVPVTGLLKEDELATFVSKASRKGGTHMKQRVMGFHDFRKRRVEPEMVFEDGSLTHGERDVHDSYFAATFLSQTAVIRSQVEEADMYSGFMNRIIPVFGRRRCIPNIEDEFNIHEPIYVQTWKNTWNRVRGLALMTRLPIEPSAKKFVKRHSYWYLMNQYDDQDDLSILSRLKHNTHRLAFILAVNEAASSVTAHHYDVALRLMRDYIQKCYAMFVNAAKATESKDLKVRLINFLHEHYARTGEWPERRDVARQRFWSGSPEFTQQIAMENLRANKLISQITLTNGNGRGTGVYIATDRDGYWSQYAELDGKTFMKEGFYANNP